jgi:Homing endonuclease associated repeat
MTKKAMSKEEMTLVVRELAEKLGRVPTMIDLERMTGINKNEVRRTIGTYREFIESSGIEGRRPHGQKVSTHALFVDWAGVVRKPGKIPTITEFQLHGSYTYRPLYRCWGSWSHIAAGMLDYIRNESLTDAWGDVEGVICSYLEQQGRNLAATVTDGATNRLVTRHRAVTGSPIYGRPLFPYPLIHAPINENGVILLFGMLAQRLGYAVGRVKAEFPDCDAFRELGPNKWQPLRIEFEYESRNFLIHKHPLLGCDLIVCWKHNWPECPIEVLELEKVVMALPLRNGYPG